MKRFFRRIRGAIGNALTWAVAWFGAGLAIGTTLYLLGFYPDVVGWRMVPAVAVNLAVAGLVTGGAFSVYLGVRHRNRHILDLSVVRSALAGAAVAAASLTGYVGVTAGLTNLRGLLIDVLVAGGLGALTAGGTILMSKHAARRVSGGSVEDLEREQAEAARLLKGS